MGKPYEGTLAWKIPWMETLVGYSLWWTAVYGVAKSWTRLSDFTFTFTMKVGQ